MLPVILVHLWCIPNKLLREDIDIIHHTCTHGPRPRYTQDHITWGVKKGFTLVEGGSKSFYGLQRGSKKFDDKKFQLPSPIPTKVFMNTPLIVGPVRHWRTTRYLYDELGLYIGPIYMLSAVDMGCWWLTLYIGESWGMANTFLLGLINTTCMHDLKSLVYNHKKQVAYY